MLGERAAALAAAPKRLRHNVFQSIRAPYGLTGVHRRRGRGGAREDHRERAPAAAGRGAGPVRRARPGRALPRALQRQLDHEPDPGHLHGARLLLQLLPRPAGRPPGRRRDPLPPGRAGVPPAAPPELRRLLRGGARRVDRPGDDRGEVRGSSTRPTPGTSTSTAPRTPTTASTRSTCGTGRRTRWTTSTTSIWVGADRKTVARLGFRAASTLDDALEMVSDTVGRSPSITYLHNPPHMIADVR